MFKATIYDKRQAQNLQKRVKIVQALFNEMAKKSAQLASNTGYTGEGENDLFEFKNYPKLQKQVEAMLTDFVSGMSSNIEQGNKQAWHISNAKNDAMIADLVMRMRKAGKTISDADVKTWKQKNLDALEAFQTRKIGGMSLSKNVWNMAKEAQEHIEMSLDLGLSQGKSAQALSRDVRDDLKNPKNLFRRVKGTDGKLRLSKRAQALAGTFGQGVYRSSYKNALRMTATETNMAYRTADYTAWQGQRYVLGYEIHLSNNHPVADICDTMQGKRFPKSFKFVGWHPWCRCYVTAIQPTEEEMDKMADMTKAEEETYLQKKQVTKMPKEYDDYIQANAERIKGGKSLPYWIKDNYVDGDITKGFVWEQKQPTTTKPVAPAKPEKPKAIKPKVQRKPKVESAEDIALTKMQEEQKVREKILAKAEKRHAKRKPAEIERIKERTSIRQEELALYSHEQRVMFRDIEKYYGIERGFSMPIDKADQSNANPFYYKSAGYRDNCSATSAVYALREMGFDLKACENTASSKIHEFSHGTSLWFNLWKSPNNVQIVNELCSVVEWAKKTGYTSMNKQRYMEFYEASCKDVGTYITSVLWEGGGGHFTIIKRLKDGNLIYIEPQWNNRKQPNLWQTLENYLCNEQNKDLSNLHFSRGVLRVDNKIFNKDYFSMFEKS